MEVDERDGSGATALHLACEARWNGGSNCRDVTVRTLLRLGADPLAKNGVRPGPLAVARFALPSRRAVMRADVALV